MLLEGCVDQVHGCESAECISDQQREMLRWEMSNVKCVFAGKSDCQRTVLLLFLLLFASTHRRSSVPKFHKWSLMHVVGLWQ